ncbi:SET domain-containing protein [Lophium mytilinum]|uniref:SET domain-containing protein n=1 Tax=Lophium mytilinum TaxID=390894 RepID=A0A6A6QBL7_9PEZI|nr:SET domain-containing protein [Lophium mytilinum]
MAAALPPGEIHDTFVKWASSQGILMDGVAPARFVGRGMGIIAARDLKKGERLVLVPAKTLISIDSAAVRKHKFPSNLSIHATLAAFLVREYEEKQSGHRLWQECWPSEEDFKSIMPLNWGEELQKLLPEPAKELLSAQKAKLAKDWRAAQPLLPSTTFNFFTYAWLIVNTRCFYWDYPNVPAARLPKKRQSLTADDCYAMCPFLDYFNHADQGCEPKYDTKGYTVTTNRDYKAGEEIYVSYGAHTNDFLLVEYGFILSTNAADTTTLDHLLIPQLSSSATSTLKEDGFYGNYTLSPTGPCHRTQAALRLLHLPTRRYVAFVSGADDGAVDQAVIDTHLRKLLEEYQRVVMQAEEEVDALDVGVEVEQKEMLARRWKQVGAIVQGAGRGHGV